MEGPTLRVSLIEVSVKRESTVHRSESVFDKSCDEEMPEMRCDEYIPFRRNKQKNLRGKGGQKVTEQFHTRFRANSRVPARVDDVEGGAVCS